MSKENVELLQAILPREAELIDVLHSDDPVSAFTSRPGAISPDLEVVFAPSLAGGPTLEYRGLEGLLEGWRDWLTPWQSYRIAVEDFIDGGDHVVMPVNVVARTGRDGVEMTARSAAVWTIEGGELVAVHFFLDQTDALRYAGLIEP
jgi:hypothetical protein